MRRSLLSSLSLACQASLTLACNTVVGPPALASLHTSTGTVRCVASAHTVRHDSLYHSATRQPHAHFQPDTSTEPDLKQQLLDTALALVPKHGWSLTTLQAAARQLGLSPAVVGILHQPELALVSAFVHRSNTSLLDQLQQMDATGQMSGMSVEERLALALKLRLSMLIPHMDHWSQALGVLAQPGHLSHGMSLLYQLMDDIWASVGDRSTDTSWYTKRLTLAGVYTSTELFMLTDYSPDYQDTWLALGRRLEEVATMGSAVRNAQQKAEEWVKDAMQAAKTAGKAGQTAAEHPHAAAGHAQAAAMATRAQGS